MFRSAGLLPLANSIARGHGDRVRRNGILRVGPPPAAFIQEGQLRHAEYLSNRLELLKEDNRAIFAATSKASQAADFLRQFSEKIEQGA